MLCGYYKKLLVLVKISLHFFSFRGIWGQVMSITCSVLFIFLP